MKSTGFRWMCFHQVVPKTQDNLIVWFLRIRHTITLKNNFFISFFFFLSFRTISSFWFCALTSSSTMNLNEKKKAEKSKWCRLPTICTIALAYAWICKIRCRVNSTLDVGRSIKGQCSARKLKRLAK